MANLATLFLCPDIGAKVLSYLDTPSFIRLRTLSKAWKSYVDQPEHVIKYCERILLKNFKQFDGQEVLLSEKFPELGGLVSQGKKALMPILKILWQYEQYQNGNFIYISTKNGNCILHPIAFAVRQGCVEIVELLLQAHFDFNDEDDYGLTLVHHAAYDVSGNSIATLMQQSKVKHQDFLHQACRNGNVKAIEMASHSKEIDFNARDKNGVTALHAACIKGHVHIVKYLIEHRTKLKINLNVTDHEGYTPLHYACHQGHLGVVALILDNSSHFLVDAPNNLGMTPFHVSCFWGKKHIVEYILFVSDKIPISINALTYDSDKKSPFHIACLRGHTSIVELFVDYAILKKKYDLLNERNSRGETPFFNACLKGHTHIVEILLKHSEKININVSDFSGVTPLHIACRQGFHDIVELLLTTENQTDSEDTNGETAWHHACIEGHLEIVNTLLLKFSSTINQPNHASATPLHLACYYGHFEVVKLLLSIPHIDKNLILPNGTTLFHIACASENCEVVKLIMNHTGVLEATDHSGANAFHYACTFNPSAQLILLCLELFKDSMLHARDNHGRTPIQSLLLQPSCGDILDELKDNISDPLMQIDIQAYKMKEKMVRKREIYAQQCMQYSRFKRCKNWYLRKQC